jgi:hypothetical protein
MADLADDENQILLERAFRAFRRLSRSARRMIRLRLWSGSDHPRHLHKTAKPSNRSPPCGGGVGGVVSDQSATRLQLNSASLP